MRLFARWSIPALASALLLTSCSTPVPAPSTAPTPTAGHKSSGPAVTTGPTASPSIEPVPAPAIGQYAVAAAHPAAVEAGVEILAQGGNAADAAVATAFAVAVVEPYASGIGGGGSVILAGSGQQPVTYDYREVVAQDGRIPASGTGIPGFVAGLAKIHTGHGDLEWSEVLEPAIDLAEEGFPVSKFLAQRMRADFGPASLEGLEHFHDAPGEPLTAGQTLIQKDLARTMATLAQDGPGSFYTGSLAQELTTVDGLDAASLGAYAPEQMAPVSGPFGDYEILSAAPPLPGAALIQQLQLAQALDIQDHPPGTAGYVDRLLEAWIAAEGSVKHFFGDPDFVDVPIDQLTDPAANAQIAGRASLLAGGAGINPPDGPTEHGLPAPEAADAVVLPTARPVTAGNTTHLSVVDADGFTVSMTNTLTSFWGGGESDYVGGFFLNNQLSRFDTEASVTNQPEPGRKSVSWSTPSMVLDGQGRPVLALGSPGGHQIPNILTGVLVAWGLQGASLQEAVNAPRFHLQDGVLAVEQEPSAELAELIRSRNWELQRTEREQAIFGSVQALQIDYDVGQITGAQDVRREADFSIVDAPGAEASTGSE